MPAEVGVHARKQIAETDRVQDERKPGGAFEKTTVPPARDEYEVSLLETVRVQLSLAPTVIGVAHDKVVVVGV